MRLGVPPGGDELLDGHETATELFEAFFDPAQCHDDRIVRGGGFGGRVAGE